MIYTGDKFAPHWKRPSTPHEVSVTHTAGDVIMESLWERPRLETPSL